MSTVVDAEGPGLFPPSIRASVAATNFEQSVGDLAQAGIFHRLDQLGEDVSPGSGHVLEPVDRGRALAPVLFLIRGQRCQLLSFLGIGGPL